MISRIRYAKIKPGMIDEYKKLASDWKALVHKYGGKVLGFYYDQKKEEVIGIAEYQSQEKLEELQKNCEEDKAFANIQEQANKLVISVDEQILEKLDI